MRNAVDDVRSGHDTSMKTLRRRRSRIKALILQVGSEMSRYVVVVLTIAIELRRRRRLGLVIPRRMKLYVAVE